MIPKSGHRFSEKIMLQQKASREGNARMSFGSGGRAPTIVADQAAKLFLDGAVVAFRQLSLEVRPDEILCIVGPSGCGKTTLLRAIAGLTDLSSGTISVAGRRVAGPADGVAMVFQH